MIGDIYLCGRLSKQEEEFSIPG